MLTHVFPLLLQNLLNLASSGRKPLAVDTEEEEIRTTTATEKKFNMSKSKKNGIVKLGCRFCAK